MKNNNVTVLKSKLHRAMITDAHVDYEGSIAIDSAWMEEVGFFEHEKVLVANIANGHRFETYIIPAPANSETICLNGAAAHLGKAGDLLVIMSFAHIPAEQVKSWEPKKKLCTPLLTEV